MKLYSPWEAAPELITDFLDVVLERMKQKYNHSTVNMHI